MKSPWHYAVASAIALAAVLASPTVRAADPGISLVSWNSTWLIEDTNTPLDFDWIDTDYDDSGWSSGVAELGFGDRPPDETTIINDTDSTTYYFRKHFNVSSTQMSQLNADGGFYTLVIRLLYDDGAVIHINGIPELALVNMPDVFIEHDTRAKGNAENTEVEITIEGSGILQEGDNVISVEVHQSNPFSSDLSFNCSLEAFKVAPTFGVYKPPQIITFDAGNLLGALEYNPNEGEPEIGWFGGWNGTNPASIGAFNRDPVTGEPVDGFVSGNAYLIEKGAGWLRTQDPSVNPLDELKYRIDLRNYTDVKVSFDIRVFDRTGLGFESNDFFKYISLTSENGQDYTPTTEIQVNGGAFESGGSILIAEDAQKRALVPTDASVDATWRELNFNDSTWHQFSGGGVGYDSAADYLPHIAYNTGTLMKNLRTTCYMRIPFNVDDPDAFEELTLLARNDDAFAAYINGHYVTGNNHPTPLLWSSRANGNNPDGTAGQLRSFNITTHLDKLNPGANMLAVHCMNTSTTSSDFLVSVRLDGTEPGGAQVVRNVPPENLNDLNFGLDGGFHRYEFDIPDSANSYTFSWEVSANEVGEMVMIDNWKITGTPLTVDSYESHMLINHPTLDLDDLGDRFADPDADGILNIFEYAFGSDAEQFGTTVPGDEPEDPPLPIMPQLNIVEDEGQFFAELTWRQLNLGTSDGIEFPFGGFRVRDIRYIPQFSTDGELWFDGTSFTVGELGDEPVEHDDGTVSFTIRFNDPVLVPGVSEPQFFARILIEDAQPFLE